jgi:hypothetical protein
MLVFCIDTIQRNQDADIDERYREAILSVAVAYTWPISLPLLLSLRYS